MSIPLHVAIRNFLKQVDNENKVVSYKFLAKKFGVDRKKIENLLDRILYDICYLVVGRIKNFYLITSSQAMMEYQLKKLRIKVKEISTITEQKQINAIKARLKHNFKSLTERRMIELCDVYSEELIEMNLI